MRWMWLAVIGWSAACSAPAAQTAAGGAAEVRDAVGTSPGAVNAVGGASSAKKRGSGPLFQVRWRDGAAAERTVRAPGEAAL